MDFAEIFSGSILRISEKTKAAVSISPSSIYFLPAIIFSSIDEEFFKELILLINSVIFFSGCTPINPSTG